MAKEGDNSARKDNRIWSILYAFTSLKQQPVRNVGIALLLAIGIALPTIVIAWSQTSIYVHLDEIYDENVYQLQTFSTNRFDKDKLLELQAQADSFEFVESIDYFPSTVGILANPELHNWSFYIDSIPMGQFEVTDTRVIPISANVLSYWSGAFEYQGNFSLSPGEILVSTQFIHHVNVSHGIDIGLGDSVDLDIFLEDPPRESPATPFNVDIITTRNLTITGIYEIKSVRSIIGTAFPSFMRAIPFSSPDENLNEPVLGIPDSVIILQEEIGEESFQAIAETGYFEPVSLIRTSVLDLISAGPSSIEENLDTLKGRIMNSFPELTVIGTVISSQIGTTIEIYLRSQIFTLLAIPILLMSMFITVFSSESAINRRQREISVLRARGASFNQISASIMWEAFFLGLFGFLLGFVLTYFLTPLMSSSTSFLIFDGTKYLNFLNHLQIPPVSIIIGSLIAMYLPGVYMIHINRIIDVSEIGQPVKSYHAEEIADTGFWRITTGFILIITVLLMLPYISNYIGVSAIIQILFVTLILFVSSYFGSRMMQQILSKITGTTNVAMGEKILYVRQSLRKRRGKFIPLLVILTLSLTTSTMMLMESASFEATLENEITYAFGADLRIESANSLPFEFAEELANYSTVTSATPVLEYAGLIGNLRFFFVGIDALNYLEAGAFSEDTFVDSTAENALDRLSHAPRGIIVSESYARLWNKTVGENIAIEMRGEDRQYYGAFEIVATMNSAPGFGVARPRDIQGTTLAEQMGYQLALDGFALVNILTLETITGISSTKLFLAGASIEPTFSEFCTALEETHDITVYSAFKEDSAIDTEEFKQSLAGIRGLTIIGTVMCAVMAIASIGLFFGSAILERKPEYAIFRALGATKKQVTSMVLGEFAGLIIAVIAISSILGILFGYTMSALLFSISPITPILPAVLTFPILLTGVILLIEWSIMFSACFYPAHVAGSIGMIEELRNL